MIVNINEKLYNFINSGWNFNEDEKLEQLRFQILNISLLCASIALVIGILHNYVTNNIMLAYIEVFILFFMFYIISSLRKERSDYNKTTTLLTIVVLVFFDALILFSKPEEMKFIWILVFTAIFIFYKGNETGWKWVLVFSFSVFLLKTQPFIEISFSWMQISYFFLMMFVLTGVTSFFQYTIEQNYKTIIKQKNDLILFNTQLEEIIKTKIMESRQKDQILFQQSKMAAMGEMIGNIAHQWRQPLNTISVVAGGLKMHKELETLNDNVFNEHLSTIHNTVQFLSQTITDFKNYFSPDKHPEDFDIKASITNDVRLIEASYNALNINMIFSLESCLLHTYKNELSQVILNILGNSKDALESSSQDEKYIFITSKKIENSLIVSIKDNAGGINEEIISKIFDPYFTTKHQSQGTGIGLFMTQEIIVKHMHGEIQVKNVNYTYNGKEFKGAQFDISLNLEVKEDTISDAN